MFYNNKKINNRGFTRTPRFGVSSQSERGFSLVETLVAISILSMSILGTFTAVQTSLAQASFSKDQITAFYLIQDAMESIRNVRDTNDIKFFNNVAGTHWTSGLTFDEADQCFGSMCTVDTANIASTMPTFTKCVGQCPFLNQNTDATAVSSPTYKAYGYTNASGWTSSKFKREISFQSISANEMVAIVTVNWTSGLFSKSITVKQSFFNLREI